MVIEKSGAADKVEVVVYRAGKRDYLYELKKILYRWLRLCSLYR